MNKPFLISVLLFLSLTIIGATCTYLLLSNRTKAKVMLHPQTIDKTEVAVFSLDKAPINSIIGYVASLSGDVRWMPRIATTEAFLNLETVIQQGETIETKKTGQVTIHFQSCALTLSPDTKVNIIQTLPANLVFEQLSGSIEYTNLCSLPLSVRVKSLLLSFDNGKTNVTFDEAHIISVSAISNTVTAAFNDSDQKSTIIQIPEGNLLSFDSDSRTATKTKIAKKSYSDR